MQPVGRQILDDDALELHQLVALLSMVLAVGLYVVSFFHLAVEQCIHIRKQLLFLVLHVHRNGVCIVVIKF